MSEFCAVHRTVKENGVCKWCQVRGMWDGFDGRDEGLKASYDKTTGLVAKPTRQDEQIASYEDPWAPAFFQPYMDFQPAPGPHTMEQRTTGYLVEFYYEWGSMVVRGERASAVDADVIGTLVLGMDEEGEPTIALRDRS